MSDSSASVDALELDKHRPHLVKFAMVQLRNTTYAEDVVQETLIAALQGAERFAGQSSVRTWLIGILKHKIMDHFRRQSREAPLPDLEEETSLEDLDARFKPDGHFIENPLHGSGADWGDPEATLSQGRFFEVLEECMGRLPRNTARVFNMREIMGMETEEICKELGITATNSWVLLYRARMALRECLQAKWFAGERRAEN
ncbi:MAG: sigma-70 family RNA polymerase sigma factor [Burkholderiales bacterium]